MSEQELREAVARVIDLEAFEPNGFLMGYAPDQMPVVRQQLEPRRRTALAKADAILALISTNGDWRLVPGRLEHTDVHHNGMCLAAVDALKANALIDYVDYGSIRAMWAAMITAAPSPPGERR